MLNKLFGEKIDLHFGGRDLIFPHHYNEAVCCAAHSSHHSDVRSIEAIFNWCGTWLHTGHLIFKDEVSLMAVLLYNDSLFLRK